MQTNLNLPSNREIEAEVLGCCFDEDSANLLNVKAVLSASDFVLDDHREIFASLIRLFDAGRPLTIAHVYEDLQSRSKPTGVGFLCDIPKGMGFALDGNLKHLRSLTARRRVMLQASNLLQQAADLNAPIGEITDTAVRALKGESVDSGKAETPAEIIAEAGGISMFLAPQFGINTPWSAFNRATGGWQRGELALLAARPSMGKSALAINAIWHAASRGIPSAFYSYEMSKQSIIKRIICLLAEVSYQDLTQDDLSPMQRQAVAEATAEIDRWPLRIIPASGKTVLSLRIHAERLQHQCNLEFAAIDYIGLIHASDRQQNRNQELGEICRQLKEMAGELNIPLLVLSQLSRAPETRPDKRPVQSDLRDSGELENHADLIAFLHRPGYYKRDDPSLRLLAELIIAKQRNGDTPTLALNFRRECGRFEQPEVELNEAYA